MSKRPDPDGKSGKRGGPAWLGKRPAGGRVKQEPDWKKAKVVQADVNAGYKLKRTLLLLGCFALFCGFVYYMIPPHNTPLVVFRASPYGLNMPPLALATEDTVFLKQVSPSNLRLKETVTFSRKEEDRSSDDGSPQKFLARLSTVRPSGPGWFTRKNVIIYIAAHGLVNDAGEACLVPPSANPFMPEEWLPLSKFLQQICALKNLKGARKIVILDCNRIGTRWRSGVLDNRFADRLKSVAEEVADDNLYIINSASSGQIAWTAPEYRASVFGHYVGRGLRGDASLEQPRDGNQWVVSLFELRDYLQERVDTYVQQRRGARQTPMLIGPRGLEVTRDIPVVSGDYWRSKSIDQLRSKYDVLATAKDLLESERSPVQAAWTAYWRRLGADIKKSQADSLPLAWRHAYVLDPIRFARLEYELMALEERLLAGQDYQEQLPAQWSKLASELDDKHWRDFPAAQGVTNLRLEDWKNLATAIQLGDAPDQDRVGDIERLFQAWRTAVDKQEKEIPTINPSERSVALRAMLYRYGLDRVHEEPKEPFDRTELAYLSDFLQLNPRSTASPTADGADPAAFGLSSDILSVEGHFLRLLRHNVSEPAASQLKTAVLARSLAERAATPIDVRTHYALEVMVNKADQERRQAEDLFFLGDPASVDGSSPMPNDAQTEQSAARRWLRATGQETIPVWNKENVGYLGAANSSRELSEMFALRDEVWATLPHWAEWYLRRTRLELSRSALGPDDLKAFELHQNLLASVMSGNVLLAEQLEQLLKNRPSEDDVRSALSGIQETYQTVRDDWQALLDLAAEDARRVVDAEGNFVKQEGDVWRFDLAMQSPLLANDRVNRLLVKYCNTLKRWDDVELPPRGSGKERGDLKFSTEKAVDDVYLPRYSEFWVKYHKLLTHKFAGQYQNHLHTLNIPDGNKLDEIVRRFPKQAPLWQVLNGVFTEYDKAVGNRAVLAPEALDLTAREDLSQWDRRVRANAFWLPCVVLNVSDEKGSNAGDDELTRRSKLADTAAHPASRLRVVDHWHLTCWHSHRLLQDFWGNGQLYDTGKQYFELSVDRARNAARTARLPFRYEIPGQYVEDLEELTRRRVRASQSGLAFTMPNVKAPKGPQAERFDATISQQAKSGGGDPLRFPTGKAGYFLSERDHYEPLAADAANWGAPPTNHREKLPLLESNEHQFPELKIPSFILAGNSANRAKMLEGRIWYRGHTWWKPFEVYDDAPRQGIRFVHETEKYPAPIVQVTGDDGPSGAVIFVFDCSYSMIGVDALGKPTIDTARAEFQAILNRLRKSVEDLHADGRRSDLKIGLMLYAHRTPHRDGLAKAPRDRMFYLDTKLHRDPDGDGIGDVKPADDLTDAGRAMWSKLGPDAFKREFPHPDIDVELLLPPSETWIDEIDDCLTVLVKENCVGVTPLYYATQRAIQEVAKIKDVATRQVIVISDGVNFPNEGATQDMGVPIRFLPNAQVQNARDWASLQNTLAANQDVRVKVVLFGVGGGGLIPKQLEQLAALSKGAPQFELDSVPNAQLIGDSIWSAFVRPKYAVYSSSEKPLPQEWKAFRDDWEYPNWLSSRDLVLNPGKHKVEVRGPRVQGELSQELELTGGELIKMEYRAKYRNKPQELLFLSEDLVPFETRNLIPVGQVQPFTRPVLAEILKPSVKEEREETRSTTFQVRLRSEFNDAFVARPRYVWAEFQPNSTNPKLENMMFKCFDLRFEKQKPTPVLEFEIQQWPKGVHSAKVNLWIRYTAPESALSRTTRIAPGENNFPPLELKEEAANDLRGVSFKIVQEQKDASNRIVKIIETHPQGTPLASLYRTRVQLNPPARSVERTYSPIYPMPNLESEVVHTFTYKDEYVNENLTLEISTERQMKNGSHSLGGGVVTLKDWTR